MSKKTSAKPKTKAKRPLYTIELTPEIRERLKTIADANDMAMSLVTRMCISSGIEMVNQKLTELREPAALAS